MLIIGSHVSLKKPDLFLGSVKEAISYGANAFMIYTGAPQNTKRQPINDFKIKEAHKLLKENNISIDNVCVHAPYIINLANPDPVKRKFAINFLINEVKRTQKLGIKQIILHPGSAVGKDRKEAIKWIAEGLINVLNETSNLDTIIALETMAGKGNEVGYKFEELKEIIDLVNNDSRIGVCFDTCHTSDAGYPIKDNFKKVKQEFDKIIGLDKITVFHINDSKNIEGTRKDRHENLGFGQIGFDSLLNIIYDEDFKNIPKILETPYYEGKAPYKHEIEMIKAKKFDKNILEKIKNS